MSLGPALLLLAVIGYLLGSIPFGLLLTRAAGLGDIRSIGSGSIGATNVLRTGKRGLAAATLALDAAKGGVAVLIGMRFGSTGVLVAGVSAMLGHLYPVWLGFRGGKGVATGLGILLAASPLAAAGCCLIWAIVAWIWRMSSAASLSAYAAAPMLVALVTRDAQLVMLALAASGLGWLRHAANIRRLLAGTEPRIGAK